MLPAGTRVGPYEVVSWLGAGGMGEVYRARDTTLDREVALKTLPEELARQPERLARLKQEARILASLNHPGIATLHGLEQSDGGVPVLVMELVEGESLADRLRRGPLPLREAATVAQEIALALEAAHEKGVLHRDLKPGNIRLAPDGRVKLLDFGLAKAVRKAAVDSRLDTDTSPHSEPGTVLGTAPYMSPEQARGQEPDRRGDIWAFGCVLYEMLAGKRAFEGATYSDTVAAVLDREPDWPALPQETPPAVLRLLRRCLQKEKDKRLHDVADARLELDEIRSGPGPTTEGFREPHRHALWPATVFAVLVGGLGSWVIQRSASRPVPVPALQVKRFVIEPPTAPVGFPTLSPDGRYLAYLGRMGDGRGLYVRPLDSIESRALEDTAGARAPFFSPDGEWIGFARRGRVMKIALKGGPAVTICDLPTESMLGASWGSDNMILFGGPNSGLMRISAEGGQPEALITPLRDAGELDHHYPEILPGGRAALFTRHARDGSFRIEVVSLASRERRVLIDPGFSGRYVPTGHIMYGLSNQLFAVGFDITRLEVTGRPVRVQESVAGIPHDGFAPFSVARDGSLAYVPAPSRQGRVLVWVDHRGAAHPLPLPPRAFKHPKLSPDGRRIAVVVEEQPGRSDLWLYDVNDDTQRRLTFEGSNEAPVWAPDGQSLTFGSSSGGPINLFTLRADGSGIAERLLESPLSQWPGSWSPDGTRLAFTESDPTDISKIRILPSGRDAPPQPFLDLDPPGKGVTLDEPQLTPDGRWLAFAADLNVYVTPFPGPGPRMQVSIDNGQSPRWSRDGRELFYRWRNQVVAVPVKTSAPLVFGKPSVLFEGRYLGADDYSANYDVDRAGRFLMVKLSEEELAPRPVHVVLNWFEELKRRVPPR
jgi:serine/threonine protein kinase/Tol biopolymer transport system component